MYIYIYICVYIYIMYKVGTYTHTHTHTHTYIYVVAYLALRSERHGAPVLICPVQRPTARSAIVVSSVSPDRCDVMTPQPDFLHMRTAAIDSVMVPIWFTWRKIDICYIYIYIHICIYILYYIHIIV